MIPITTSYSFFILFQMIPIFTSNSSHQRRGLLVSFHWTQMAGLSGKSFLFWNTDGRVVRYTFLIWNTDGRVVRYKLLIWKTYGRIVRYKSLILKRRWQGCQVQVSYFETQMAGLPGTSFLFWNTDGRVARYKVPYLKHRWRFQISLLYLFINCILYNLKNKQCVNWTAAYCIIRKSPVNN